MQLVVDIVIAVDILVSFCLFGALLRLAICSTVTDFEQRIDIIGTLPPSVVTLIDAREAISFFTKFPHHPTRLTHPHQPPSPPPLHPPTLASLSEQTTRQTPTHICP